MEVILLEDITNVGKLGDKIAVKAGFARNFLLPKGKAVTATSDNTVIFEQRRAELEKRAAEILAEAKQRAEQLESISVTIPALASDEGKLYGSLGPREVADAIEKLGIHVEKREVQMPLGPIRELGEHSIDLYLHMDVVVHIPIVVIAGE